jgi:hypothetical protein
MKPIIPIRVDSEVVNTLVEATAYLIGNTE